MTLPLLFLASPLLLGLFALAAWPWRWPVPGAPVWMPMTCLAVSGALLALFDPWQMALLFVVYPVLLALFVLSVRLSRPEPGDPQLASLRRGVRRG